MATPPRSQQAEMETDSNLLLAQVRAENSKGEPQPGNLGLAAGQGETAAENKGNKVNKVLSFQEEQDDMNARADKILQIINDAVDDVTFTLHPVDDQVKAILNAE